MVARAPEDALDYIGHERLLIRGPSEGNTVYRARLLGAWRSWKLSGTKYGILYGLAVAGWNASSWDSESDAWPAGWLPDGDVWVFDAHDWTPPAGWNGDDTWWWMLLDGYNFGMSLSPPIGDPLLPAVGDTSWCVGLMTDWKTFEILRTMVRQWNAAHAHPETAFVVMSSGHWDDVIGGGWRIGAIGWTVGGNVLPVAL